MTIVSDETLRDSLLHCYFNEDVIVAISDKKWNLTNAVGFNYDMNLHLTLITLVQVSASYLIPSWSYEQIEYFSMLFYFTEMIAYSNTLHGTVPKV